MRHLENFRAADSSLPSYDVLFPSRSSQDHSTNVFRYLNNGIIWGGQKSLPYPQDRCLHDLQWVLLRIRLMCKGEEKQGLVCALHSLPKLLASCDGLWISVAYYGPAMQHPSSNLAKLMVLHSRWPTQTFNWLSLESLAFLLAVIFLFLLLLILSNCHLLKTSLCQHCGKVSNTV